MTRADDAWAFLWWFASHAAAFAIGGVFTVLSVAFFLYRSLPNKVSSAKAKQAASRRRTIKRLGGDAAAGGAAGIAAAAAGGVGGPAGAAGAGAGAHGATGMGVGGSATGSGGKFAESGDPSGLVGADGKAAGYDPQLTKVGWMRISTRPLTTDELYMDGFGNPGDWFLGGLGVRASVSESLPGESLSSLPPNIKRKHTLVSNITSMSETAYSIMDASLQTTSYLLSRFMGESPPLPAIATASKSVDNAYNSRPPWRNVFAVLKHRTLFVYSSDERLECIDIILLTEFKVDLFPEHLKDSELYLRETPVRMRLRSSLPAGGRRGNEKNTNVGLFLYTANGSDKEDWFFMLRRASHLPLNADSGALSTYFQDSEPMRHFAEAMSKLKATVDNLEGAEGHATAWLNALVGRAFVGLHANPRIRDWVISKLSRRYTRARGSSILGDIVIQDLSVGNSIPVLSNPKLLGFTADGDVDVEVDIDYTGGVRIEAATVATISVSALEPYVKPLEIPLVVAIKVKRFSARVLIKIKPSWETSRVWVGFHREPELKIELEVEPIISNKMIRLSLVNQIIERRIKEALEELVVLPNMDDFSFWPSDGKGGIFWDSDEEDDEDDEDDDEEDDDGDGLQYEEAEEGYGEDEVYGYGEDQVEDFGVEDTIEALRAGTPELARPATVSSIASSSPRSSVPPIIPLSPAPSVSHLLPSVVPLDPLEEANEPPTDTECADDDDVGRHDFTEDEDAGDEGHVSVSEAEEEDEGEDEAAMLRRLQERYAEEAMMAQRAEALWYAEHVALSDDSDVDGAEVEADASASPEGVVVDGEKQIGLTDGASAAPPTGAVGGMMSSSPVPPSPLSIRPVPMIDIPLPSPVGRVGAGGGYLSNVETESIATDLQPNTDATDAGTSSDDSDAGAVVDDGAIPEDALEAVLPGVGSLRIVTEVEEQKGSGDGSETGHAEGQTVAAADAADNLAVKAKTPTLSVFEYLGETAEYAGRKSREYGLDEMARTFSETATQYGSTLKQRTAMLSDRTLAYFGYTRIGAEEEAAAALAARAAAGTPPLPPHPPSTQSSPGKPLSRTASTSSFASAPVNRNRYSMGSEADYGVSGRPSVRSRPPSVASEEHPMQSGTRSRPSSFFEEPVQPVAKARPPSILEMLGVNISTAPPEQPPMKPSRRYKRRSTASLGGSAPFITDPVPSPPRNSLTTFNRLQSAQNYGATTTHSGSDDDNAPLQPPPLSRNNAVAASRRSTASYNDVPAGAGSAPVRRSLDDVRPPVHHHRSRARGGWRSGAAGIPPPAPDLDRRAFSASSASTASSLDSKLVGGLAQGPRAVPHAAAKSATGGPSTAPTNDAGGGDGVTADVVWGGHIAGDDGEREEEDGEEGDDDFGAGFPSMPNLERVDSVVARQEPPGQPGGLVGRKDKGDATPRASRIGRRKGWFTNTIR
ncbi:hypothetical protein HK101_012063 [Irineochytrium annulatum]|nr:hypothetical protein HK101_012063 [Irineochytrium annulatum]